MITLFFSLILGLFTFMFFIFIWNKFEFLKKKHNSLIGDQQIHIKYTPRIGGLVIFTLLIIFYFMKGAFNFSSIFTKVFLVSLIPLAIISMKEDIFLNTKPMHRLVGIFITSALVIFFSIPDLPTIDLPLLSTLMNIQLVKYTFFILALTLLANGMNLIDGSNGLSGFTSMASIIALGIIAFLSNDIDTMYSCLIFSMILLSFLFLNYPLARVFLGDTGAYLNGIIIGFLIINFYGKHPELPAWSAVLLIFYPIVEVIFSFFRKLYLGKSPFFPDSKHLHIKLYRILNKGINDKSQKSNYLITPFLTVLWLGPPSAATIFFTNSLMCIFVIIIFLFLYGFIYISLPENKNVK